MRKIDMFSMVIVLVTISILLIVGTAHGDFNPYWQPTPTPLCSPTITIAPASPSIPTSTPAPQISVVPTVTPTVVRQATVGGNSSVIEGTGSSTNAPGGATCNIPFSGPVLTSIIAGQSGTLTVNWLASDQSISSFSIIYGLVGKPLSMGVNNIPNKSRSFTIQGLPSGSYINAQIWGFKGGCAEKSSIVDPLVN